MPDYLLFGSLNSGHSYKARLALLLLGLEHDYRPIDIRLPREERDPEWRRVSRFGEVPVLVAGGRVIVQSNAILLHLAREHGALGWERDPDAVTQWLFWEANRIGFSLPNYRYHTLFAPGLAPDILHWLRARLTDDLTVLEKALDREAFLAGGLLSAADISCAAYLLYRDLPDLDLASFPAVSAWLDRIAAHPRWRPPREVMG